MFLDHLCILAAHFPSFIIKKKTANKGKMSCKHFKEETINGSNFKPILIIL